MSDPRIWTASSWHPGAVMLVVVDASALLAILFGEPGFERVAERLQSRDLASSAILPYEVANVARQKVKRHKVSEALAMEALNKFSALQVQYIDVDPLQLFITSGRTGLTAYDASYQWVAQHLGAELVTLDDGLEAAAAKIE